jgi:two-component system sensor histidine kinase/response regulator
MTRSASNNSSPKAARLLVVDDQENSRKIIGGMLEGSGFDVVLAASGDEALEQLGRHKIDLVLLDVFMPGRDGLEICRHIRAGAQWEDLPIIFLSAADEKTLIVRALEIGGVDYVTKPFNQSELMSRVRTHLALKTARDQLKQLAEDKDELLGILAHDLKNHLGGMEMSVQLMQRRAALLHDSRLERMAANIHDSTSRMLAFVKEFLANSAAERGPRLKIERVSLKQAAAAALRQYAEAARRKGVQLEHSNESDAHVAADRKALDQVLDNLISNAVKFSAGGSSVRVTVSEGPDGGGICRVQDEGPGFTESDKGQMFQRYRRLSARPTAGEPSTGLGLSIVKKLVQAMDGQIECESRRGKGSAFILHLPGANGHGLSKES